MLMEDEERISVIKIAFQRAKKNNPFA